MSGGTAGSLMIQVTRRSRATETILNRITDHSKVMQRPRATLYLYTANNLRFTLSRAI